MEVEDGPFGFRAFLAAASLVASRAFHVDDASGQGLVPVADLFNHAGGGDEHVHFEDGDSDDDSDSDDDVDADSESDDARVEAEMRRLAEADPDPSGAAFASFEAFEALEKEGGAKLTSNVATYEDAEDEDVDATETARRDDSRADRTLRLVAVRSATRGDELFNTFGDHGNALLLHKYGFVEWTNALSSGGVTISPTQLCELFGSREVYFEAFAALEGGFAELESDDDERDREAEADVKTDGDASPREKPWESAADAADPGAAAARAAGWSGGKYEISASGNLSRDLLLLLTTALADCDEEDAFFKTTGLPPGLEAMNDDALLCAPGVAEAALAVIKMRREALPRGTVEGDLRQAREYLVKGNELEAAAAATNGVAGVPAAFVLRANERATCECAASRLVHRLRRLAGDDDGDGEDDARQAVGRVTDVVPLQDTPYGAVVYLPKRDSFARTERTEERMHTTR